MSDTLPFSEVKAHLSEVADRVEREHDRILVTRNGRPSFVLVSPDDLAALEESLAILRTTSCWSPCASHAAKPLTATRCPCAIRCRTGLVGGVPGAV